MQVHTALSTVQVSQGRPACRPQNTATVEHQAVARIAPYIVSRLLLYCPGSGAVIGLPYASARVIWMGTSFPTLGSRGIATLTALWDTSARPALTATARRLPSTARPGKVVEGVMLKVYWPTCMTAACKKTPHCWAAIQHENCRALQNSAYCAMQTCARSQPLFLHIATQVRSVTSAKDQRLQQAQHARL